MQKKTDRLVFFKIVICIFILTLVKLTVTARIPILPLVYASADDNWAVSLAENLSCLQWLGPYTHMTLIKRIGFPMLLYLSALQDISPEIMEAAEVDGANARQRLFQITLPLLKRTIYLVIMLQVIASFKVFGQIRLITKGGPANKTRPLIMYIYQQAFDKNKLGYAAAMSYALFLILIVCTIVQLKLQKGDD